MLKKYRLNSVYSLEICSRFDNAALNGMEFDAETKWIIEEDLGDGKLSYTTEASKRFNLDFFKCDNAKVAIQKVVSYAYTGKESSLKSMWFKIIRG